MCGRYQIIDESGKLRDVFPSEPVAVLTAQDERQMRWGFSLPGGGKRLLINARSESAGQKITFSHLMNNRCLIPAAAFYEWDRAKQPHLFSSATENTFYMAGLYRIEQDGEARFVILTRAADHVVFPIHSRMPCLFTCDEYSYLWLHSDSLAADVLSMTDPKIKQTSYTNPPESMQTQMDV